MATSVLVHEAWDTGWSWRGVSRNLQAAGHEVFTPTMTGSGERFHLASPDVDLQTHIVDVANVLSFEDLQGVVLCGSSFGAMVITGVAEQVPQRIEHLVYLDAFVPEDGQSAADLVGPEDMGFIERARAADWTCIELPFEHWPFLDRPQEAATLLLEVALNERVEGADWALFWRLRRFRLD